MKYVIHSTIIFNTTEYTLTSLNDPHISIKLSNSAGHVLEELIKYRNTNAPVTREHLFLVVWKNYGLEPSNGNLNQQISLIRKIFITLGLHGSSIITIPKRGLKLNNQLIIEKIKSDIPNNSIFTKDIINHQNNNLISPVLLTHVKSYMKYTVILTTITITMLIIGCIYFHIKQKNIKLYCCKEIDTCNICTFNITPELEHNECNIQPIEII